jgi:osmotically-inducible protein OsmY
MHSKITLTIVLAMSVLLISSACSTRQQQMSRQEAIQADLAQAGLNEVSVSEDASTNTITLGGTVPSDEEKKKAGNLAEVDAGTRTIVNNVSVQPPGKESLAYSNSELDKGIKNSYKAALEAKGLNEEHIQFDAKNGVLTLKGNVQTPTQRKEAEQLAQATPNVLRVVNELDVQR